MERTSEGMSRTDRWSGLLLSIGILVVILSVFAIGLRYIDIHHLKIDTNSVFSEKRGIFLAGGVVLFFSGLAGYRRSHQRKS